MSTAAETPNSEDPAPARLEVLASNDPTAPDAPVEKLPATSAAAPPVSVPVGELLREAREKLGLSSGDIATRLRMGLKQVIALENSDFAAVPTGTFLRGFVRNYAKAVSLNADEVLALLEKTHSGAAAVKASSVVVPSLQNIKVPAPGGELATPNGRALVIGIVILLLLAAVWYWWEYVFPYRNDGARAKADAVPSIVTPQLVTPAPPAPVIAPEAALVPAGAPPAAVDSAAPNLPPEASTAAAISGIPRNAAASSAVPPAASATVVLPQSTTIANKDLDPAPARAATAPGARNANLGFTFSGESWVEVIDAGGKTILSRRFKAGDAEEVFGRAPFSVVVGNAKSTRMAFNGREFALEPHTRVSVARVTVK